MAEKPSNGFVAFLAEKWVELIVVAILLPHGCTTVNLYREVGEFKTSLAMTDDAIRERIDGKNGELKAVIDGKSGETLAKIESLGDRIDHVETALAALSELPKDLALLESRIDALTHEGKVIQQTAVHALPPEPVRQQITQCGVFNEETAVPGQPGVHRWKMLMKVDPSSVIGVHSYLNDSLPGYAITAKLSADGQYCDMEIKADDPGALAANLKTGLGGCVTVTYAGAPQAPDDAQPYGDDLPDFDDTKTPAPTPTG